MPHQLDRLYRIIKALCLQLVIATYGILLLLLSIGDLNAKVGDGLLYRRPTCSLLLAFLFFDDAFRTAKFLLVESCTYLTSVDLSLYVYRGWQTVHEPKTYKVLYTFYFTSRLRMGKEKRTKYLYGRRKGCKVRPSPWV